MSDGFPFVDAHVEAYGSDFSCASARNRGASNDQRDRRERR